MDVRSYVKIANVRGRPLRIEHVAILPAGEDVHPSAWLEGLPKTLDEGMVTRFTFDRTEYPSAVPVAIDSAGRVWPRRRWWWVRRLAMLGEGAAGVLGVWWRRNGPSERQLAMLRRRLSLPERRD